LYRQDIRGLVDTDDGAQKISGVILQYIVKQVLPLVLAPGVFTLIAGNSIDYASFDIEELRDRIIVYGFNHLEPQK
jgi:hypothetical protein